MEQIDRHINGNNGHFFPVQYSSTTIISCCALYIHLNLAMLVTSCLTPCLYQPTLYEWCVSNFFLLILVFDIAQYYYVILLSTSLFCLVCLTLMSSTSTEQFSHCRSNKHLSYLIFCLLHVLWLIFSTDKYFKQPHFKNTWTNMHIPTNDRKNRKIMVSSI